MLSVLSLLRRAGAALASISLVGSLSGCFLHTDSIVLDAAKRGDADWLVGAWIDEDDVRYSITREGVGLYRFSSEVGEPEAKMRQGLAMLIGDCSVELSEFPKDACAWTPEQLCADEETRLSEGPECVTLVSALRDPAKQAAMPPREAEAVEALRWLAEGMPWRDDVLFMVAPLPSTMLGEKWAAAQVRRNGSFGPYTDIGILAPQLLTNDLVLVEQGPEGDLIAWATEICSDGDDEAPVPTDTALTLLTDCAGAIAEGRLGGGSKHSIHFRPDPGR